jgi:aminoglycoside phosphotransferase (APT) family kinase protein
MTDVPGLDLIRLRAFLDAECPGLVRGPLRAEVIQGGRSNLTYDLTDGVSCWVARRPPLGHVLRTAHDMSREYRVLTALAPTAVPVPATVALCTEESVCGAPVYVMEKVSGAVYRTAEQTATLGAGRAGALSEAMIDVLADLHEVDPSRVGLADFGRPEGYLDRQLRRWRAQLDASRSRPLPGIEELHEALAAEVPGSTHSGIVHGDYRLDNLIVGAGDEIAAVLDWEMATLGDPLTDVGILLVYWDGMAGMPGNAVSTAISAANGFPTGRQLAERYAERRGVDLSRLSWYVAFGFFKLAVIAEGIHFRYVAGKTVGAGFERFAAMVPALVDLGHRTLSAE